MLPILTITVLPVILIIWFVVKAVNFNNAQYNSKLFREHPTALKAHNSLIIICGLVLAAPFVYLSYLTVSGA